LSRMGSVRDSSQANKKITLEDKMTASTLSAWSIFIALIGVSLNAIFVKPYAGRAIIGKSEKENLYRWRERFGYFGNLLIVTGTFGQFASIVFF
jgi:hypothetical protein